MCVCVFVSVLLLCAVILWRERGAAPFRLLGAGFWFRPLFSSNYLFVFVVTGGLWLCVCVCLCEFWHGCVRGLAGPRELVHPPNREFLQEFARPG
jgi:hypothetical protein